MKKAIFVSILITSLFFGDVLQAGNSESNCNCDVEGNGTINCSDRRLAVLLQTDLACSKSGTIDLSHNNFQRIPEESINSLKFEFLNISSNKITNTASEHGIKINTLDISWNKIKTLDLTNYRELVELYATNNIINDIKVEDSNCDKIKTLDLSRNKLNNLTSLIICRTITYLDVSLNEVQKIPEQFHSLSEIKHVNFTENELSDLDHLPKSIQMLDVSRNKLVKAKKIYFANLRDLQVLNLSKNSIENVEEDAFTQLFALEILDLSSNKLKIFPPLVLEANVRSVSFVNNSITNEADVNNPPISNLLDSVRKNPVKAKYLVDHSFVNLLEKLGDSVNCTCVSVTQESATLTFCTEEENQENQCSVNLTTSPSPTIVTTPTTTSPETSSASRMVAGNTSTEGAPEGEGPSAAGGGEQAAPEAHLASLVQLGGAKLSFLGFLLLVFLALLGANCAAGDPVVNERWWEEKLHGDRVLS